MNMTPFTRDELEEIWERATGLPPLSGAANGPLTNAIIDEAFDGSLGEYDEVVMTLGRILDDIQSFVQEILAAEEAGE
jgi:hypothetical protein